MFNLFHGIVVLDWLVLFQTEGLCIHSLILPFDHFNGSEAFVEECL